MKIALIIAAILGTALCAPNKSQVQGREIEKELAKLEGLTKQAEMEQYYDGTQEEDVDVQAQELNSVLEDLLRQTNSVSVQDLPAELQGFWSSLKSGLGRAFRIANKGVQLYSRHVAPLLNRPPQRQMPQRRMPRGYYARKEQIDDYNYAAKQEYDYAAKQEYDYAAKQEYDYAGEEQYNYAAKQEYDYAGEEQYNYAAKQLYNYAANEQYNYVADEGMNDEANAQFIKFLGGLLKKLFG